MTSVTSRLCEGVFVRGGSQCIHQCATLSSFLILKNTVNRNQRDWLHTVNGSPVLIDVDLQASCHLFRFGVPTELPPEGFTGRLKFSSPTGDGDK